MRFHLWPQRYDQVYTIHTNIEQKSQMGRTLANKIQNKMNYPLFLIFGNLVGLSSCHKKFLQLLYNLYCNLLCLCSFLSCLITRSDGSGLQRKRETSLFSSFNENQFVEMCLGVIELLIKDPNDIRPIVKRQ